MSRPRTSTEEIDEISLRAPSHFLRAELPRKRAEFSRCGHNIGHKSSLSARVKWNRPPLKFQIRVGEPPRRRPPCPTGDTDGKSHLQRRRRLRWRGRSFATANVSVGMFRVKRRWRQQRRPAQRLTPFRSTCRDRNCTKSNASHCGRRDGASISSSKRPGGRYRRQIGHAKRRSRSSAWYHRRISTATIDRLPRRFGTLSLLSRRRLALHLLLCILRRRRDVSSFAVH